MIEILALIIVIWLIKGFIFGWGEDYSDPNNPKWDDKDKTYY